MRVAGAEPPLSVLANSWSWAGLIVVMAVCGVITSWVGKRGAAQTLLLAVLAGAAVIGPLEQARLHTVASLGKHVGLGAWFAAIAAGYAADRFVAAAPAGRMRAITCGACVVALVFPVSLGVSQSRLLATGWPNASTFTGILRPLVDHGSGRLLVEDPSVAEYYLPAGRQWQRWSSTRNIVLPSGASTGGPASTGGRYRAPATRVSTPSSSPAATSPGRIELLGHHRPGPPYRRRPPPEPSLPHRRGHALRPGPGRPGPGYLRDLAIRAAPGRATGLRAEPEHSRRNLTGTTSEHGLRSAGTPGEQAIRAS